MSSYFFTSPPYLAASTIVIAAVSVVLPWSTCPIVPTFTCGLVRSNFALAIAASSEGCSRLVRFLLLARLRSDDLVRLRLRHFLVVRELHRVHGAPLAHRAKGGRVPE